MSYGLKLVCEAPTEGDLGVRETYEGKQWNFQSRGQILGHMSRRQMGSSQDYGPLLVIGLYYGA